MPRDAETTPSPPSLGGVFLGFLGVGMIGFGGVLPLARRMIVEQRRWMSGPEFSDLLALCQFLPGGNVINLSVAVGYRFHRVPGALAGLIGLMAAPVVVVILLGLVYARFQDQPVVRRLFAGLAAAAAGLVVATVVRIAAPLRGSPVAILVALICFAALAVLRLPLLPCMLVLAPASVLLRWRWR